MLSTLVLGAGIIYAALCIGLFVFQSRMVYFPARDLVVTPTTYGHPHEDVWLTTDDGTRIHGWRIGPTGPGPTVLFFHGNAGNISHRIETIDILRRLDLRVLIIDYHGYGLSEGSPGERETYEDAAAAWRHLVEVEGVRPEQIVVFGRSLGTGIASWLAANEPAAALVLESGYTSLPDVAAHHYPLFPVRWLARMRYPTLARLAAIDMPVLIMHARRDEIIPYSHGEALYAAASEPKVFLELEGHHNDGFMTTGAAYVETLRTFIGDHVPAD